MIIPRQVLIRYVKECRERSNDINKETFVSSPVQGIFHKWSISNGADMLLAPSIVSKNKNSFSLICQQINNILDLHFIAPTLSIIKLFLHWAIQAVAVATKNRIQFI